MFVVIDNIINAAGNTKVDIVRGNLINLDNFPISIWQSLNQLSFQNALLRKLIKPFREGTLPDFKEALSVTGLGTGKPPSDGFLPKAQPAFNFPYYEHNGTQYSGSDLCKMIKLAGGSPNSALSLFMPPVFDDWRWANDLPEGWELDFGRPGFADNQNRVSYKRVLEIGNQYIRPELATILRITPATAPNKAYYVRMFVCGLVQNKITRSKPITFYNENKRSKKKDKIELEPISLGTKISPSQSGEDRRPVGLFLIVDVLTESEYPNIEKFDLYSDPPSKLRYAVHLPTPVPPEGGAVRADPRFTYAAAADYCVHLSCVVSNQFIIHPSHVIGYQAEEIVAKQLDDIVKSLSFHGVSNLTILKAMNDAYGKWLLSMTKALTGIAFGAMGVPAAGAVNSVFWYALDL